MTWQLNPFAVPLQLGAFISLIIAYASWQRIAVPGRKPFALFMLSLAVWMAGYGVELTAVPSDPNNLSLAKIEFIGIALVAPFWLLFLLQYGGYKWWDNWRHALLLFIIPTIVIAIVWVDPKLMWPSTSIQQIGNYIILSYDDHSFWYNLVHVPYAYLLFLTSAILLIYIAWRSPYLTRGQGAALVASFFIPFTTNVLYVVGGFSLFPGIDISPFVIIIFGLVASWIVFQLRLLDTAPVAYHAVVSSLPDGVVVLDQRNVVVELNATAQKIFQRDQQTVYGLSAVALLPQDWQTAVSAIPPEIEKTIELTRTIGNGTEHFEMQVAPLYDRRHRFIGRVLVLRDVTASKRATADLFASQQRLETVVSSAPVAIFACDAQGIISAVTGNEAARLNLHAATLVGKSAYQIFHNDPELIDNLNRALAGETFVTTFVARTQTYELWYKPSKDAAGQINGMTVVGINITERKHTEKLLQEAQRLESIGLLAGGIAHDFNNLLASVMGQASLALEHLPEAHDAASHINLALEGTERAAELTRQLLAYAGKGHFEQRVVDFNELLQSNAELLQTTISKRVQLQLDLASTPTTVMGDRGQFQQLIMNLVINAAEAIEASNASAEQTGAVMIRTRRQQSQDIADKSSWRGGEQLTADNYVLLQVVDTGGGIADETMAHIFEPFFTTKPMGRGLGLSATLGIIRSHGGALNISSKPGWGTTFSVLLPYTSAVTAPTNGGEVQKMDGLRGATVLIVDDEAAVRRTLSDMLASQEIEVLEAANGRLALDIFTAHQSEVALVFLDMQMPVMDGAETFRQLRQLDPHLKVIVTSGYSADDAMYTMSQDQWVDFIQKPFRLQKLLQKAANMMNRA